MPLSAIENSIRETYLVVDEGIVKVLLASVVAHRMNAAPIWLFVVGPSGGGKTAFLDTLSSTMGIHPVSSVTPQTFVSGQQRKSAGDPSLLTRIQNGIIVFKDFTTLLSMQRDARAEIMGQMREIYDGKFIKHFGNGSAIGWQGKISVIAGTTDKIYLARELYAAMGERFIMYYPKQPQRKDITMRAMNNVPTMVEQREHLAAIVKNYLDTELAIPKKPQDLPEKTKNNLIDLADFATLARSPVERDNYGPGRDILFRHDPEMPTRFAEQLAVMAAAFIVINKGDGKPETLTPLDHQLLYKVALDSISIHRRLVLQKLTYYEQVETSGLATAMNYPTTTVRRWLEDLAALEIVERIKGGRADNWKLKPLYRELMAKYEDITQTNNILVEAEADITALQQAGQPALIEEPAVPVIDTTDMERELREAGIGIEAVAESKNTTGLPF